jgi:hypothetical protein
LIATPLLQSARRRKSFRPSSVPGVVVSDLRVAESLDFLEVRGGFPEAGSLAVQVNWCDLSPDSAFSMGDSRMFSTRDLQEKRNPTSPGRGMDAGEV